MYDIFNLRTLLRRKTISMDLRLQRFILYRLYFSEKFVKTRTLSTVGSKESIPSDFQAKKNTKLIVKYLLFFIHS